METKVRGFLSGTNKNETLIDNVPGYKEELEKFMSKFEIEYNREDNKIAWKNIKKLTIVLLSICTITIASYVFSGCRTSKVGGLGYSDYSAVIRLQDTNRSLTELIDDSRKRLVNIRVQASGVSESIDRAIYLFGEYQSEVNRLLDEIDKIRAATEIQSKSNTASSYYLTSIDSDENINNGD